MNAPVLNQPQPAAPAIKGWCPSALLPMESGDGWLVRIKPQLGQFSTADLRAVARAARRYGNGLIDLTNRGNLQIRGLSEKTFASFSDWVVCTGLAAADPKQEAVRNILVSPLAGADSTAAFDARSLARDVQAVLETSVAVSTLPDKFGIVIDGGGRLPLADCAADIAIRPVDKSSVRIEVAGASTAIRVPLTATPAVISQLLDGHADWMRKSSPSGPKRNRFANLVADRGEAELFQAITAGETEAPARSIAAAAPAHLGHHAGDAEQPGFFGIGAPLGRFDADALEAVAAAAVAHGNGLVRMTPWKAIILAPVSNDSAAALKEGVARAGGVVSASDPRSRFIACSGAPKCRSAYVDTHALVGRLVSALDEGEPVSAATPIHVSGCAKGCAHPRPATFTVVATEKGFDIVRNGAPADPPETSSTSEQDLAGHVAAHLKGQPA